MPTECRVKNRIKILHMTPPDIKNGVYRYIFNHMEYMDMERFQFAFLTKGADALKMTKEYRQYGFPVHKLHNTQRESPLGLKKEIREILGQGYDKIHLHTSSWRGFLIEEVAMEMGIGQVIVHSHSTGIDETDEKERRRRLLTHCRYKDLFSMEYATDVCACSVKAADWLFGARILREQIQILPNAVDVEKYRFHPGKRKRMRTFLKLENRIVVGNVGRYSYQKNQEFLIRAFAKAHAKNSSLFLLCMGEGELKEELEAQASELGIGDSVLCMGWQEDVEEYLHGMDVFCLPSRFEGFPISVIEAQASGLRCLVSDQVTDEVKITDLVKFLPLAEERWAEALAGIGLAGERELMDEMIADGGYDIKGAARKLEALYRGD